MRDKRIHDYFGVDYEIVWDVVINKIPALKEKIQKNNKSGIKIAAPASIAPLLHHSIH